MSSVFVYATKENVSEYIVKSGAIYRVATDHLGSPRMVINATSGEIISRFDYDEYGNVTTSKSYNTPGELRGYTAK
jgi:uncharacterized protein RhaS with RHS repeats